MSKKVTMEKIALRVGVSKNAVSLALRGMPGLGDDLRSRILGAAEEMGYHYKKGEGTLSGCNQGICISLSRNAQQSKGFFQTIQYGIEKEARNHQIHCLLSYHDEEVQKPELPLCVSQGIVQGVVCIGGVGEPYYQILRKANLSIVLVDHYLNNPCDCVLTDNVEGAYAVTSHLIQFGHQRIGFYGPRTQAPSFFDRWLGYQKALATNLLSVDQCPVINNVEELACLHDLPTAFVCCNDATALELMADLSRQGLRVPEDLSVVGFDNINAEYSNLTTMHVRREELGCQAVQRLLRRMSDPNGLESKILLPTYLVQRSTVKRLK